MLTKIKELTFDILENMLFETLQNIACKVFEKAITNIDSYLRKNRERGKLKTPIKEKNIFSPVSLISSISVPVIGTGKVKVITF